MIGLRLGVVISLVLLGGVAYAEGSKNVSRPLDETQQFEQGKKIAIVVGVASYDQRLTGFRKLDYADKDAEQVAKVLSTLGYKSELLVNDEASRSIILSRIRELGKTLRNGNGTMVFYFSGHGFAAGRDNYLATYGSVAYALQDDGLGVSDVVKAIRDTKVRRAVLLVDACRNDPEPGKKSVDQGFKDIDTGEGVQIFYSTRFGDVSWENDALKHGIFSHFLVEGLSGSAGQGGQVTFNSLASYVENQVSDWTSDHMPQTQQPYRSSDGDFYGDFVLARLGTVPATPPAPVAPLVAATPEPTVAPEPVAPAPKSFEPTMVDIPAGKFTMGCEESRDVVTGMDKCYDDEKPAHEVMINAFKMAETETTFDQWDACEKAKACPHAEDQGWGRGTRPVINVSWDDITQKYIPWLNKETGKDYRLPSEAEWEYAARGGTATAYPWGNSIGKGNANCGSDCGDTFEYTAPVGKFAANGYGLRDMNGNVWEWVLDSWHDNYKGAPVDGSAWQSGGSASRVMRGGSSFINAQNVRSARRLNNSPVYRYGLNFGFRLASGL